MVYGDDYRDDYGEAPKSTHSHASEKAIESYILPPLPPLAVSGNRATSHLHSRRCHAKCKNSKDDCPNLGYLLVAALISNVEITEKLIESIVRERITRNVVWMLDPKGSAMAELSYLSDYHLKKTFEAGKTSYRLLMFLKLFRRVAVGDPRKPLAILRDEAFERHGAPPHGSAKKLAASIKNIHQVSSSRNSSLSWALRRLRRNGSLAS